MREGKKERGKEREMKVRRRKGNLKGERKKNK